MAEPKKIIDKVIEKRDQIKGGNADAATKNQQKAIAAILGGIKSKGWKTYMMQFVDDSDPVVSANQLMRLLATDGTAGNEAFDKRRAYLVANGTCGEGTGTNLANEVDTIDDPA